MAGASGWWRRSRGLPAEVYRSWVAAHPSGRGRVLAWADAAGGYCIASLASLSAGDDNGWHHVGWHEIQSGGWNAEAGTLSWLTYDGRRNEVELQRPGRLPEVFRERVAASIVVEQFVPIRGSHGVTVSGRRDLADQAAPVTWHSTLERGLTHRTPGVAEAVAAALARVRADYDLD